MRQLIIFFSFFLINIVCFAQARTDAFIRNLLTKEKDSLLQHVLQHPEIYRYQIIYTQINRDKDNNPSFINYYYNYDSLQYFNPASTVKMPLAFLSLEKINDLDKPDVNRYTCMQFDSSYSGQTKLHKDSTAEKGVPSIAHFIRKAFLVSDNDAYNRMYEWVGQQITNRRLHAMGYPDLRITRRFRRMTMDENRHTNAISFVCPGTRLLYTQGPDYNTDSFDFSHSNKMGKGYLNARDSLINEPIDFTYANNVTVWHLQQLLQSVMFPNSVPLQRRFRLTEEDYRFLYRYLSQYPSESAYPKYDTAVYYDNYVKFFFRDGRRAMPEHVRVFNKVGWAYGCLTDVSYVADAKNKVEFMLTATIYVNNDGILNDDKYEYDSVGYPFLYQLGQAIYRYELKRERKYRPDFSAIELRYEKRPDDGRPVIKEVDN